MTPVSVPPTPTAAAPPVDRAALRVLAHPVRSRLIAELRLLGAATATELADILETNSGVTSYHLRALAEAGLVVDAPSDGQRPAGRRRYWSVATDQRTLEIDDEEPDDEAAAEWLARDYVNHFSGKAQTWIGNEPEWPLAWQELCGLDDHLVLVTDVQLQALQNEIVSVLARYRRVGAGNPQAKRVTYYTCALPVDAPPRT